MKLGKEFEKIKIDIENIEQIFDKDIKVIYRLSDSEKDIYLVDYDGVKLKLRIIEESEIEIKRIMLLSKIQNPNIEKIVYYKIFDNKIYLLSNYFPGSTLFDYVNEKGRIGEKEATRIIKKLTKLLKYLHHIKPYPLVFRDLQPKNIIINDEEVFLIDIETINDYRPGKTFDTGLRGTVGFMAPEQYGFGQADIRTDIYSLGMCFYYMISGKNLVFDNQMIDYSIIKISANGVKMLRKMTEFSPDKRYQNVDKIIEIIEKRGRSNEILEKAYLMIIILIAITLGIIGVGNGDVDNEYSQLISNAEYQQSFGNATLIHTMPLKFNMLNYRGDFESMEWYSLPIIGSDNNDKSTLGMMYSIADDNIYIRYKLKVEESMKNILFSFADKNVGLSSCLEIDLPNDNYDFIQQYELDELNELLKENSTSRYILEIKIGEESPEIYYIDLHQIFIENHDRFSSEKYKVNIEIYDYFEGSKVDKFIVSINRNMIISKEGEVSLQANEWENKVMELYSNRYLSQRINVMVFGDETYKIPVVKYKPNEIQGFINGFLRDDSMLNFRMYLIEKNSENMDVIINRKDYVFKGTKYFSFIIEPDKEYILAYKMINNNDSCAEKGYIGRNGNVHNVEDAVIITSKTVKNNSYNLILTDD